MYIVVIETKTSKLEIATGTVANVADLASVLEHSKDVVSFYVTGLNILNQPAYFGCKGMKKWESPISH